MTLIIRSRIGLTRWNAEPVAICVKWTPLLFKRKLSWLAIFTDRRSVIKIAIACVIGILFSRRRARESDWDGILRRLKYDWNRILLA